MLKQAPLESAFAMGWNTRGEFDIGATLRRISEAEPGPRRALQAIDKSMGVPLEQLLSSLSGSGYLTASAKPNGQARFSLALRLDDEAPVKAWLKARWQAVTGGPGVALDLPVWVFDDLAYASVQKGWLVLGNDQMTLRKLLLDGHPTLGQEPLLDQALTQVRGSDNAAIVAFSHGERMREMLYRSTMLGSTFPDDEMAFWDYAVASVDMGQRQTNGFLSIPGNGTAIGKALVSSGGFDGTLLGQMPTTSIVAGLDLGWLREVLEGLAQDSPDVSAFFQGIVGDMKAYDRFSDAFPGSAALATDFFQALSTSGISGTSILFSARVGDAVAADPLISKVIQSSQPDLDPSCASNLKNIGTGMEMWSTDNAGRYPTSLAMLTPDYLRRIPNCPAAGVDTYSASLQTGPDAEGNDEHYQDYYLVKCLGEHHPNLYPDHPRYNGVVGLTWGTLPNPPAPKVMEPLPSGQARRRYEASDTLAALEGDRGLVRVALGPKAATWLSETEERKLPATVQDATKWAGADLLGLVYLDYAAGQKAASALLESVRTDEAQLLAALLDELIGSDAALEDVHALRTTPDGLVYRGQGLSSSRALGGSGLVAAAIVYPNFVRARQQGQLTACKSNLKNIATGLEMWSTDNAGRYPTSLEALVPNYLRAIPLCPSAGKDTYSASLQTGLSAEGNEETKYQDYYIVKCLGHNHHWVAPDYPQYNCVYGLVEDARD